MIKVTVMYPNEAGKKFDMDYYGIEVAGSGQVVLCETHVGRLRAPRGWELIDARSVGRL